MSVRDWAVSGGWDRDSRPNEQWRAIPPVPAHYRELDQMTWEDLAVLKRRADRARVLAGFFGFRHRWFRRRWARLCAAYALAATVKQKGADAVWRDALAWDRRL